MKAIAWLGFLVTVLIVGCKPAAESESPSGKLNGLHKYYYSDGSLYLEGNFKDSIPHGTFRQYHKNGKVYEEANYVEGIQHGITKRYHEDGTLSMEVPYDSGRVHGIKRKFRKDGTLAYEAPYHYDKPCVGLKEYYTSGNPVTKFPKIVIEEDNKMWEDSRYSLRISLSSNNTVEFYKGYLTDGKYIGTNAEKIYTERDGTARLDYPVPPGMFVMEKINIIAKVKTDLDNYYITQTTYNLAVENR